MPYRKIVFTKGHYYHVYNRGTNRIPIFQNRGNYLFLLKKIKQYQKQFNITIIAYCLMPNHYHFLLRQDGDESISTFIHRIFNSYTKAYNKKYERSGTLFEGRFKAIHIENEGYLLYLCKYIHANPVKALLVEVPEEWEFSNYLEWIGKRNGSIVNQEFVEEFGKDYQKELREHLLQDDKIPEEVRKYLSL